MDERPAPISSVLFFLTAICVIASVFLFESIGLGLWITAKVFFFAGFITLVLKK